MLLVNGRLKRVNGGSVGLSGSYGKVELLLLGKGERIRG